MISSAFFSLKLFEEIPVHESLELDKNSFHVFNVSYSLPDFGLFVTKSDFFRVLFILIFIRKLQNVIISLTVLSYLFEIQTLNYFWYNQIRPRK